MSTIAIVSLCVGYIIIGITGWLVYIKKIYPKTPWFKDAMDREDGWNKCNIKEHIGLTSLCILVWPLVLVGLLIYGIVCILDRFYSYVTEGMLKTQEEKENQIDVPDLEYKDEDKTLGGKHGS